MSKEVEHNFSWYIQQQVILASLQQIISIRYMIKYLVDKERRILL